MGAYLHGWLLWLWAAVVVAVPLVGPVVSNRGPNAILIAGAVSRMPAPRSGNGQFTDADSLYDPSRAYSAVHVCAKAIDRHIVKANGIETDYFLHSWNIDLEHDFRKYYNFTMAEFEDNRPYEKTFKPIFPTKHWAEISFTLSVQRVVGLMLQHEVKASISYKRVVLIRPDVFINTDLLLSKLPASPKILYCNTHGNGAGDFHFVMERAQAERLATALYPRLYGVAGSVGNHGSMKKFAASNLNATVQNDNTIFAGFNEEVYRKVPWHHCLCNAPDWWRAYMAETYGMTDADWAVIQKIGSFRKCSRQEPALIMKYCCRDGTCTETKRGDTGCGKRLA
mmetsp:Transcript_11677/g.27389  ORF Transcript_11677/g.27389 Transcript_11677/m.27389 type:complete len:338 (+) Transcript_11677:167-1180(+)